MVLEGWKLGNKGLYRKYWSYKKIMKISKFYFGPGSPKNRCLRFFRIFFYETNPGGPAASPPQKGLQRANRTPGRLTRDTRCPAHDNSQSGPAESEPKFLSKIIIGPEPDTARSFPDFRLFFTKILVFF